jgi:signal transduction histidine kinase
MGTAVPTRLPPFRRLTWQAAAVTLVLLASALGAFGAMAYTLASRGLERELGRRLVDAARLSALQLSAQPLPAGMPGPEEAKRLRQRLARLADAAELERLLLLDQDGRVLGDSLGEAEGASPYVYLDLDPLEWKAAREGRGEATTLFQGGGGRYFKSAFAPLPSGGRGLVLRAEASAGFLADLKGLRSSLLLVGAACLALGLGLAVVLTRPLVAPLRSLIAAAGRVAGGDFSARVDPGRRDELGQLSATFNDMAARLGILVRQRERLAALGEVAAGMAHEIRNPLAAIEGFASLAQARLGKGDPEAASHLRDARKEVALADAFISDFLEYARPRPPRPEPCDLGTAADSAAASLFHARGGKRWTLRRVGEASLRWRSDPGQLRQILVNILKNAREAMPKGGVVVLGVERGEGVARLWVRDEGPGIPTEALEGLFKPFVTSKPMGTGLGLSIAQKLAEGLGGTIEVQSAAGEGSVFILTLPEDGGGTSGKSDSAEGKAPWPES